MRDLEKLVSLCGFLVFWARLAACSENCVPLTECPSLNDMYQEVRKTQDRELALELKSYFCSRSPLSVNCPQDEENEESESPPDPSYFPKAGECGINPSGPVTSIGGGNDTKLGEVPFMALLGYPNTRECKDRRGNSHEVEETKWLCGGTVINQWYILTAGHCQKSRGDSVSKVRLGEWQVSSRAAVQRRGSCYFVDDNPDNCQEGNCLPKHQDFDITPENIIVHPDYRRKRFNVENDIALIKLPRAVKFNAVIQAACLPWDSAEASGSIGVPDLTIESLAGAWGRIVGWGFSAYDPETGLDQTSLKEDGVGETNQQKLDIEVQTEETCSSHYAFPNFTQLQLCAGGEVGKFSCGGDSGGPFLMTKLTEARRPNAGGATPWYIMGIVSFGQRNCGAESGIPGVYTSLTGYIDWIRDVVQKS